MNNCAERQKKLRQVMAADFCLVDANLYLDTHPGDIQALQYFKRQRDMAALLRREYTALYGPLCATDAACEDRWNWVDTPWPWEMEA